MTRFAALMVWATPAVMAASREGSLRGAEQGAGVRRALTETYQHVGCFADKGDERVLNNPLWSDEMTAEVCYERCHVLGAHYMSTQYGRECWCSREEDLYYQEHGFGECDMECSGNHEETCGGLNAFDLYRLVPADTPTSDEYVGCFVDTEDRVMMDMVVESDLTPALCRSHCEGKASEYYATQYGNECFCGASDVASDYEVNGPGTCHMPCAGDDSVACGGYWAFSLYKFADGAPSPTPQVPAPTPSPVMATAEPVTAGTPEPVMPLPAPTPQPVGVTAEPVAAPTPMPVMTIMPVTVSTRQPVYPDPAAPTPSPVKPVSPTPSPVTPVSPTPSPVTPVRPTPSPVTPVAPTPSPVTPVPPTPSPVTPVAPTPSPVTPVAPTPSPVTPVPPTPSPVTPVAPTPSPVSPVPPTPSPVSPTPSPVSPTPEPVSPSPDFTEGQYGQDYSGDGTYYGATDAGNCAYGGNFPGMYSGMIPFALNAPQYGDSLMCGACLEGTASGNGAGGNPFPSSFKGFITDQCPECSSGDLDAAVDGDGRWDIEWHFVPCPGESLSFKFEGSNSYFWKIQPQGTKTPVVSTVMNGIPMARTDDNFFELDAANNGVGPWEGSQTIVTTTLAGVTQTSEVSL